MSKMVHRLYDSFRPESYSLDLNPDKQSMTIDGYVTIEGLKVGPPSKRLTFHQSGLKITEARITYHNKSEIKPISVSRINHHDNYDEVRLHTDELLYAGKYKIILHFSGKITRPMNGIYPCYFKENGRQNTIIATQFESHHAREAFPCIDEPEAKAVFKLILKAPNNEVAISNTLPIEEKIEDRYKVITFAPTPKMSTYLLAFVYGRLEFLEAKTKRGVAVRTYATPKNVEYTKFALEVAVKCLNFYEDYFGIPYPLEKCDFIALPDFASGAMENWGCITFREQTLLVDAKNTSQSVKQYVAMVVAHELAHQWFGNLVTMSWWTDLWLNEGFASWIEYLAVDHMFPKWQIWTQFTVDEMRPALNLDSLDNTHPIEVPIKHPDEITSVFDTISYNKGASVIHMLQGYLGAELFRDGLRAYLKKHAYGNTKTDDLWSALEEVSKRPVKKFMNAWTSQPGYPIVKAQVNDKTVEASQERFLINRANETGHSTKDNWPIPLLSGSDMPELLEKPEANIALKDHKFLKFNTSQTGFYRVIYDDNHLTRIKNAISQNEMQPEDRMGILNDSLEASKAGYLDTTSVLNLLASYDSEDNAAVWDVIADVIGSIRKGMDDDEVRESMKPFVRQLVSKQLKRLGWNEIKGESYFDTMLRPTVLALAASADEPDVIKEINKRFSSVKKSEDIHPDLRAVIYATVARLGGPAEFDKLLKLYTDTTSSEERVTLTMALCSFEQPGLVKMALALIDSDKVKLQDATYWIAYSFSNRHARMASWEWLGSHWVWIVKNLGKDISFSRLPLYAARGFTNTDQLKMYKSFFNKVSTPVLERSIRQGIETIEWQSAWRKRELSSVKKFFKA